MQSIQKNYLYKMESLVFKIILILVLVIGLFGAILPVLPGAPLSFTALLIAKILGVTTLSAWVIAFFGLLTLIGVVLDYLLPLLTVKKMGGSKWGALGLFIGLVVGIVFSPFGLFSLILAPFLGAFIGEILHNHSSHQRALKSSLAALLGFVLTTGYGVVLCLLMLFSFVFKDLILAT